MKKFMTFALLAAFALPVATTPMFAKNHKPKKVKKAKKQKRAPRPA